MRWSSPASISSRRARGISRVVLGLCLAGFGFAPSADAEVHVSGDAGALKIVAQGASLDEVLHAVQGTVKFQYSGTLPDQISGTYSGSLRNVISRLLVGHDYIMRGSQNDLSVDILGAKDAATPNRAGGGAAHKQEAAKPDSDKPCLYKEGDRMVPVEC